MYSQFEKVKPLSLEEQLELGRDIVSYKESKKRGLADEALKEKAFKAHEKFVTTHLNLVYKEVAKFFKKTQCDYYYPHEDAIQDVVTNLCEKVWDYDPSKGFKFITFYMPHLKKELVKRSCKYRPVPMTTYAAYGHNSVRKAKEKFEKIEDKRLIDEIEFIQSETGYTKENIYNYWNAGNTAISLSRGYNDDFDEMIMNIPSPDRVEDFFESALSDETKMLLSHLNKREKDIICSNFIKSEAYKEEVLKEYNLTNKEYNKEVESIIKKLRGII